MTGNGSRRPEAAGHGDGADGDADPADPADGDGEDGDGDGGADVEATLARYGELTRRAIEDLLTGGAWAPYLTDLLVDYPQRGGKAIRPALVLAACQAFGGTVAEALGPAVAIEVLHNAFLVHDDVEDQSRRRRGQPTLHRLHGVPLAVNAGDALAMLSLRPLRDPSRLGSRLQQAVVDEFLAMTERTLAGQAKELGWRRDNVVDLGPRDYLELIASKTCWYTTVYPLRVGALIGSRHTADLEAVSRFGFYLGAAFQIRDDLLNLIGSEDELGKELFDDVREGKRTLMLIHLLGAAPLPDRRWVQRFLAKPHDRRTPAEVARVVGLMREHGSVDFAAAYGHGIATAAHAALGPAFAGVPRSTHVRFIERLVPYMVERRH